MIAKKLVPKLATAALIGALTIGVAAPAMAQADTPETEEHRLPNLKARCSEAIDQRLDHLAHAQARVDEVETLTARHEAAIDDIIDNTQSGLTQLSNQVEVATEPTEVLRLCATVAPDYRVYLVVLPQTHLTIGADRAQVGSDLGDSVLVQLDEAIARAADAGADVADAQMYRDQSAAHLDAADAANDGVASAVLGVTPDSYNNGDGEAVLDAGRASLRNAHAELKGAKQDGEAALKALRDAVDALV